MCAAPRVRHNCVLPLTLPSPCKLCCAQAPPRPAGCHCPPTCAEKEAWEAANALREVHIPPIVLNPDCSFGLAEPDKQLAAPLPDAAPAASGPEQQAQQSQQQASQQQQQQSWRQQQGRQTQAAPQRAAQQPQPVQRSQRMQEGLPSGTVELQQLPPATQQAAQQPGVCGTALIALLCCCGVQLPLLSPCVYVCRPTCAASVPARA